MERTMELRDKALEQHEADEREEAAYDGDEQKCSLCQELRGCADDVVNGEVSFLDHRFASSPLMYMLCFRLVECVSRVCSCR